MKSSMMKSPISQSLKADGMKKGGQRTDRPWEISQA
jgi:hypothetical protein